MFKASLVFTATILASLADAAAVSKRSDGGLCYGGVHNIAADRPFVQPLADACYKSLHGNAEGFWSDELCVGAAIAAGVEIFIDYANCGLSNETVPTPQELGNLDYGIYASIVGSCAYDENACSITMQNFIDLVYGSISTAGTNVWPDSAETLILNYITPIFTWTNFTVAEGVPYHNFNDWLHYSGDTPHFGTY